MALFLCGFKLAVRSVPLLVCIAVSAQSSQDALKEADRLADQGNWYAAAPFYRKAEEGFRQSGDKANEIYACLGRLHKDAEVGAYRRVRAEVVQIMAEPVVQDAPRLKIRALSLLGTIDLNLNTSAALQDWNELLAIAKATGDAKWENRAKGELGLVAGVNGNIGVAAMALSQAIAKSVEIGDIPGHIHFSVWLANGMAVNGMADRALTLLDRAAATAMKNGFEPVPLQLSIGKVRALTNLPDRAKGVAEAKKLIATTLSQAEASGIVGAQTELLNRRGTLALQERDFATAENSFRRVAEIAGTATLRRIEAEAYRELSTVYRAKNEPAKASVTIDRAIEVLRQVEEEYRLPQYLAEKAEVEAARGNLTEAESLYTRALDVVEGLLVNATSPRVKAAMIGSMSDMYLGHFWLVVNQLHDDKKAFQVVENARGRALYDSIRYARQSPATKHQSIAETEITNLQRRLVSEPLSQTETRKVLARLDSAYERLAPIEYARNRSEMALLRKPPVSTETIRRQLRDGEVLAEYVLDDEQSHVIQIDQTGLTIHRLPGRRQIAALSNKFVQSLKAKADSRDTGRALYDAILAPVVDEKTASLIVVPDGPLHLVPFAALSDQKGDFVAQHLTVTVAPSATIYSALRNSSSRTPSATAFLGVLYTSAAPAPSDISQSRGIFDIRGAALKPLAAGREEIIEASQAIGVPARPEEIVNSEAALKKRALSKFRIIHVAAHGVGDEQEPDRAALVLSAGGAAEDGLWQAREIRSSRLSADLVVLSACETGTGRLQGQEGVMNLARAFLTAGAKSVIASLWSVEDRSTATLMSSLYKHLAAGLSVSDALRQAQLDFIKDYGIKAHPYLWAGFEVIGDGTRRIYFAANKTQLRPTGTNLR